MRKASLPRASISKPSWSLSRMVYFKCVLGRPSRLKCISPKPVQRYHYSEVGWTNNQGYLVVATSTYTDFAWVRNALSSNNPHTIRTNCESHTSTEQFSCSIWSTSWNGSGNWQRSNCSMKRAWRKKAKQKKLNKKTFAKQSVARDVYSDIVFKNLRRIWDELSKLWILGMLPLLYVCLASDGFCLINIRV